MHANQQNIKTTNKEKEFKYYNVMAVHTIQCENESLIKHVSETETVEIKYLRNVKQTISRTRVSYSCTERTRHVYGKT
jgi:hypothetical protein